MTKLADYMHGLGLGWWIKNPDDTGDSYATDMFPLADAVLTEQCNQYSSCGLLSAYVGHKAVFNAEYRVQPAGVLLLGRRPRVQWCPVQRGPDRRSPALPVAGPGRRGQPPGGPTCSSARSRGRTRSAKSSRLAQPTSGSRPPTSGWNSSAPSSGRLRYRRTHSSGVRTR